ncbi:hypothetical protein [Prescottella agglutinans]|uniref:hypothetical protein n=1 Tax=Prescottella agglutinans TaxID=1644129 RepID=UPI000FDD0454|nr:hypothetical protein [Prescottella agglutinans]
MPSPHARSRRAAVTIALTAVGAVSSFVLAGCASDTSTAEPTASATESTSDETGTGSAECAESSRYGDEGRLFGREWLLAYKRNPTTSGVSLLRCHYAHEGSGGSEAPIEAAAEDLVPPPSFVTDGTEVQKILVSLPDSTDRPLWRCPSTIVTSFDEYAVLDPTGTPVATFQIAAGGSPCGMFRVVPSS